MNAARKALFTQRLRAPEKIPLQRMHFTNMSREAFSLENSFGDPAFLNRRIYQVLRFGGGNDTLGQITGYPSFNSWIDLFELLECDCIVILMID